MSISEYEPPFNDRLADDDAVLTPDEEDELDRRADSGYPEDYGSLKRQIIAERLGQLASTGAREVDYSSPTSREVKSVPHRRRFVGRIPDSDSSLDPNWNVSTGAIQTQEQSEGLAKLSIDADEDWVRNKIESAGLTEVEARARLRARKEKLKRNA